jgi:hypothetical protein
LAEFLAKTTAMGFWRYWKQPSDAFDGILVALIIGRTPYLLLSNTISATF